jgi:hypothetical protein
MTTGLRIFLLIMALLATGVMLYQLRHAKLKTENAIFWIFFFALIILLAAFPQIAFWGSSLVGIQTPVVFVFLIMITLLIVKIFSLSIQLSKMESKFNELAENIAIEQFETNRKSVAQNSYDASEAPSQLDAEGKKAQDGSSPDSLAPTIPTIPSALSNDRIDQEKH